MDKIQINKQELDYNVSEAYKSLRTNIRFCGSHIKAIAVTSSMPSEGKTTTAFNLSMTLAESGSQVVFVDADMRKSGFLAQYVKGRAKKGLSHYLSGQCKLNDAIYETDIDGLCVIAAGPIPPNPSELLGGPRFKEGLNALKEVFDYVIIDNAPLGYVIDCAVIAPQCDGVVMVLESGKIPLKQVQAIKKQIEKTGSPILGVVLNKTVARGSGYYYSYYGKKY